MEKNNNGKLAIAIVAMFVVALSIVGFTYAYFVASVNGNTGEDQTYVEVQAGILKIAYDNGQTLYARNIVPGWKSDGHRFYDPVCSISEGEDGTHITAVTNDENDTEVTYCPDAATGATAPVQAVTFKVTDQSTKEETAYYGIRLIDVDNELFEKEPNNFKVTLKSDAGFDETITLTNVGTQYIGEPVSITTADQAPATVHTYTLSAEYVEAGEKQTSTGKSVTLTVDVVGLQFVNGVYKDAEGNTWGA